MNFIKSAILILFLLGVNNSISQPNTTSTLTPDLITDVIYKKGEQKEMEKIDKQLYERVYGMKKRANGKYVIPVVVHIIHQNGTENISDVQVLKGIQHLNDAFANTYGTSIDTEIEFCLAVQDPNGNLTTGINRIASSLTNMDSEIQDQEVKDLIRWDTYSYLNIWIVKEVRSGSNYSVAGYAYLPSSHGTDHDGIVMEAAYFGSTFQYSSVITHEMGHYLGLYHTFEAGCKNNDCTRDGDKMCDTPPDGTSYQFSCASAPNSCTTDADDISLNNPFRPVSLGGIGDQSDMQSNYMDYSDLACYSKFTSNQKDRMRGVLENTRHSLLESVGCQTPCTSPIVAAFSFPSPEILTGTTAVFTNTSTGGLYYNWSINGIEFSTSKDASYPFSTQGTYTITLKVSNNDINCTETVTKTIHVKCNISASFSSISNTVSAGDLIQFTNTSTGGLYYNWSIDGIVFSTAKDANYTFLKQGIYTITLQVKNNDVSCIETYSSTITVTCDIFASFIYTSNSVSPGDIVHFTNTSKNAKNYRWYVNGLQVSVSENFTYTFSSQGTYEVSMIAENGICEKTAAKVVITVSTNGLPQTGIPVWPLAVSGNYPAQTIDWRTPAPITGEISATKTNGGMTGAGFSNCGELMFYALHTGSGNDHDLFIYSPEGVPLLNNTINAPGLNGVKGSQEIQVVPVPGIQNQWYIIYKKWSTDVGAWSSGVFTPTNWIYSRIEITGANTLIVHERDIELKDNLGNSFTYVDGAAVSRTVNGDVNKHYLFLSRIVLNVNSFSVDRFIIDNTGIHFDKNSGSITSEFWRGCISGSPIELSPTEDKLALIMRNDYETEPTIFLLNASTLNVLNSICAVNLKLQNDGTAKDQSAILPTSDFISSIASSHPKLKFLTNINRRIWGLEFSPNGKFLYFTGGGYATSQGYYSITYVGQIDLQTNPLEVRLQIQDIPDADYSTGLGCAYSSCSSEPRTIYSIQSCYDGNLYFTKNNESTLFVIPNPNDFLPQNLIPHDINLATTNEPNIQFAQGFSAGIVDQIDGYNYLESNSSEIFISVESLDCNGECVQPNTPISLELRDQTTNQLIRTFIINKCPQVISVCVDNSLTYSLSIPSKNLNYRNAIIEGVAMYTSISFISDTSCPEICNNEIDDDYDGLIDLYDPDCSCQLPETQCETENQNFFGICNTCQFEPAKDLGYDMKVLWKTNSAMIIPNTSFSWVGDIDGDCQPEVLITKVLGGVISGDNEMPYHRTKEIEILDGKTGIVKYSLPIPESGENQGNIAIADIDRDGLGDIFLVSGDYTSSPVNKRLTLIRYEYNGSGGFNEVFVSERLQSYQLGTGYIWKNANKFTTINIADVNYDGIPEINVGNQFFNAVTGDLLCSGPVNGSIGFHISSYGATTIEYQDPYSVLADVLPDDFCPNCSGLELVAGNMIYSVSIPEGGGINSGKVSIEIDMSKKFKQGSSSIADLDMDGLYDIVTETKVKNNSTNRVYAWNPRTGIIYDSITVIDNNLGIGRVAIGDIDGATTNDLEIVVRIGASLDIHKFNPTTRKFSLLAHKTIYDYSITAVSLFDFNGDKALEVVYRDEDELRIFEGKTLNEAAVSVCSGYTMMEYPVIADITGDGSPEIIIGCGDQMACFTNASSDKPWMPARSVWNQAAYFGGNVNDDLTIPREQQKGTLFKTTNTFQAQMGFYDKNGEYVFPAPDASALLDDISCEGSDLKLNITIHNYGIKNLVADIPVTIYNESPQGSKSSIIKQFKLGNDIFPGDSLCLTVTIPRNGISKIFLVVNDNGLLKSKKIFPTTSFGECSYDNNIDSSEFNLNTEKVDLGKDTVLCSTGGIIVLNAGDSFTNYIWQDFSDLSTFTATEPGIYSVTATDFCGNTDTDSIEISIDDTELDVIQDIVICNGKPLNINVIQFVEYTISPQVNLTKIGSDSVSFVPDIFGEYIIEGINKRGCFISDTFNVKETKIEMSVLGNDTTICFGDTLTYDVTSITGTFEWSNGHTGALFNIYDQGSYSVKINSGGCYAYDTIVVSVSDLPYLELGKDTSVCTGSSILFDVSIPATTGTSTYIWEDGSSIPVRSINTSGTYMVTVSDGLCKNSDTVVVSIGDLFAVNLGENISLCKGDTLQYNLSSYNGTYEWNDGSVSPQKDITESGYYSVSVSTSLCDGFGEVIVTFLDLPDFSLPSDSIMCDGNTLTIDLSTHILNFEWYDGSTDKIKDFSYPGEYYISASDGNCSIQDTFRLDIIPLPEVNLGNDIRTCLIENINIGNYIPNAEYLWNTGSILPEITINEEGTYIVTVTIDGCSSSDEITVIKLSEPVPPVSQDVKTCLGSNIKLSAVGNEIKWYSDEMLNNLLSSSDTLTPMARDAYGEYTYYVTQTVDNCESDPTKVLYTIETTDGKLIIRGKDSVCEFQTEELYVAENVHGNINWNVTGNHFSQDLNFYSIEVDWEKTGIDTIYANLTDEYGCNYSSFMVVYIAPFPEADFTWSVNEQTAYYQNTSRQSPIKKGEISYDIKLEGFWDFGRIEDTSYYHQNFDKINDVMKAYYAPDEYQVSLYVKNEFGCADTITYPVFIDAFCSLYIPNAMVPEHYSDKVRVFKPVGTNISEYEIWLFDKWGNLIWYSNELTKEGNPAKEWDGKYEGITIEPGSYFWKIEATCSNGTEWKGIKNNRGKYHKMGTINVIR